MLLKQVSEIVPWREVFALGFGTNVNRRSICWNCV